MTKTLHRALDIKIEKLTKNIGSGVGHFYSGCTGLQIEIRETFLTTYATCSVYIYYLCGKT